MIKEAAGSSETSVDLDQATRFHITENCVFRYNAVLSALNSYSRVCKVENSSLLFYNVSQNIVFCEIFSFNDLDRHDGCIAHMKSVFPPITEKCVQI
jgi:hypothetical protein